MSQEGSRFKAAGGQGFCVEFASSAPVSVCWMWMYVCPATSCQLKKKWPPQPSAQQKPWKKEGNYFSKTTFGSNFLSIKLSSHVFLLLTRFDQGKTNTQVCFEKYMFHPKNFHFITLSTDPSQIFFTRFFNWSPWKKMINTDLWTWSPWWKRGEFQLKTHISTGATLACISHCCRVLQRVLNFCFP